MIKHTILILPFLAFAMPSSSIAALTNESFDRRLSAYAYAGGNFAGVGQNVLSSDAGAFSQTLAQSQSGQSGVSAFSSASGSQDSQISADADQLLASGNLGSNASVASTTGGDTNASGESELHVIFDISEPFVFSLDVSTSYTNGGYVFVTFTGPAINYQFGSERPDSGGNVSGTLPAGRYYFDVDVWSYIPAPSNPSDSKSSSAFVTLNVQAVPEPSQYAAGISCLCALLAFRRRAKTLPAPSSAS